jgi:hypothetical protein
MAPSSQSEASANSAERNSARGSPAAVTSRVVDAAVGRRTTVTGAASIPDGATVPAISHRA